MSLSQSVRVHEIMSYANDVLTCVKLHFVTPSVLTSLRIIIHWPLGNCKQPSHVNTYMACAAYAYGGCLVILMAFSSRAI